MLRVLVILALLYVIWCTVLYLLQDQIAFPANLAPSPRGEVPYPGVIELTLDVGRDAEVLGWLVPAPEDADRPAPVVVYFHGNAEIIDMNVMIPSCKITQGEAERSGLTGKLIVSLETFPCIHDVIFNSGHRVGL